MKISFGDTESTRRCGGCTLCCKLVPVKELGKPANTRCDHQRAGKGCLIHATLPISCRMWSCLWLQNEPEVANLKRPDRAHYVLDPNPDYITLQFEGDDDKIVPVVQVWLDPDHPHAHRDPGLRSFLQDNRIIAIVRTSSSAAFVLCPPACSADRRWHEERSGISSTEHSFGEVMHRLSQL